MNHYAAQRRGSLNTSQRQDYDYNVSPLDGRARYGPPSNVKPQSLPSRPVDPQGEHALPRKYSESLSNVGIKATHAAPSTYPLSDLEKLRALKKAIMDGQLPGYDATPRPQALEALYTPRIDSTSRTNDRPADTYHKHEDKHTPGSQSAPTSAGAPPRRPIVSQISTEQAQDTTSTVYLTTQGISVPDQTSNDLARSPTTDRPAAPTPTDDPSQPVTTPQAAHESQTESQTESPTSMVMSPIDSRLVHHSSVIDMELDSPPPSAAPPLAQEDSPINAGPAPTANQETSVQSAQRDQDRFSRPASSPSKQPEQPPALSNSRSENGPESGPPVAAGPSLGQRTYPDDSKRQGETRQPEYRSQQPYASDRRSGIDQAEAERSGPRSPESNSQRAYRRASYPDPRRESSGPPQSPNDRRRYDYYESSSRFANNRSPPPASFLESRDYDSRLIDSGRVIHREPYPGPNHPVTNSGPGGLQPRTSEDGRYFYPPPRQSSLPPGARGSLPPESNPGSAHVKAETPDDGEIGRRSTTPRSVGESVTNRASSSIPGRVPDGLPSRPPPTMKEPLTPRSLLMPDRIAEPRQYVPLAARLTSPNDYVQRGSRSGPPTNAIRGPPVDGRRSIDDTRYSSPTDRESWSESGRIDDPFRREPSYSRPDDARDYRIVPRTEWERSRSPQSDRYPPPISGRPPSGYPYGRDRSLSPPRRSETYPRPGYPDIDDSRGTKRPRQELMDPEYRRPPPLDWRLRDEYDPRVPPPPRQAYADPRGPYTRPPPPDAYRSYDREPYPPDNRPRQPPPPYGNDRERYPPDQEWLGRPPYRR